MNTNTRFKWTLALWIVVLMIVFIQCNSIKSENQGVTGTVTWLEGNQMPMVKSPNQKPDTLTSSQGIPVTRKIKVYPLTNLADVQQANGLFQSVKGEPVAEVSTDESGRYSLLLPSGRYSIFTEEEDGLFANNFDGDGNIAPLLIRKGEWIQKDIVINYKAYF